jgi:PAS domain-containing protein
VDDNLDRLRRPSSVDSVEKPPPLLLLDDEGTIRYASNRARDLLDAQSSTLTGQSFLDRVHPRTTKRVLHDLAEMAVQNKQRATWLLRLQTELGPWQWFKVSATNQLDHTNQQGIVLRLSERGGGTGRPPS